MDLANETSTVTLNPEAAGSSAAVDQLGHTMPEAKVKEHNELMWSVIDSAFKYSKEDSASIPQDEIEGEKPGPGLLRDSATDG